MSQMQDEVKAALKHATDQMAWYYDHWRSPTPADKVGAKVWLNAQNYMTTCLTKKLDHKWLGPFVIEKVISPATVKLHLSPHCRQENGSLHDLPMETSFSHWNTLLLSQDKNPIVGRIFARNPNIQFLRCLPNRDVISSLNPPNSHDPNGGTYIWIGGLLKEK